MDRRAYQTCHEPGTRVKCVYEHALHVTELQGETKTKMRRTVWLNAAEDVKPQTFLAGGNQPRTANLEDCAVAPHKNKYILLIQPQTLSSFVFTH